MAKHLALPVLLFAGYFLLILAWVFSNPPGAAPDEAAHYIKAAAVRDGDIVLDKRPSLARRLAPPSRSERWMLEQARLVSLPRALSPEVFRCWGIPGRIQPCTEKPPPGRAFVEELTYVGSYPPAPYLLPGMFMKLAPEGMQALYLGRAAAALLAAVLLGLSVAVLWDPRAGWLSVAGAVAVISPMVIFVAASISGSGVETAAALCFFACLMRLARTAGHFGEAKARGAPVARRFVPGWIWWTTGISGALLATARDLGLLWVLLQLLIFFALAGVKPVLDTFRSGGRALYGPAIVLALSAAAALTWQLRVQVRPPFDVAAWMDNVRSSDLSFNAIVRQQIGIFGPLDTVMPRLAYLLWMVMVTSLVLWALFAADNRRRLVLFGAAAAAMGLSVALNAAQAIVGFGVQGRYLLPLVLTVPVLAAEILVRTRTGFGRTLPWAGMVWAGLACGVHLLAWYTIAKRYSVGLRGPAIFSLESAWQPPGGWLAWGLAAALGSTLMAASALPFFSRRPGTSSP